MRYTRRPGPLSGIWSWWGQNKTLRRFVAVLLWMPFVFGGCLRGCVWFLDSASEGTCSNSVGSSSVSPDGTLKAVVFGRGCMLTSSNLTHISLLQTSNNLPNDSGNVFVATGDHRKVALAKWGGPPVRVSWKSNTHLQIVHPVQAEVFQANTRATMRIGWFSLRTVTVEYKTYKANAHKRQ